MFVRNSFIAVLFFYSCSQVQNNQVKNDLIKAKIKGQVLKITETRYDATNEFGKIETQSFHSRIIIKYNDWGNEVERGVYNNNGELTSKIMIKYNNRGDEVERSFYNNNGELTSKIVINYNDKGKEIENNTYENEKLWKKIIYKYNNYDQKIEQDHIWSKNLRDFSTESFYKYDEQGNKIEDSIVWIFDKGFLKNIYNYDAKGNKINEKVYNDRGLVESHISKYDDKNNLIEDDYYITDSLQKKNFFIYDSKENIIETKVYYADALGVSITRYNYEFDKKNNWIKRIVFENNKVVEINEREVEYKPTER